MNFRRKSNSTKAQGKLREGTVCFNFGHIEKFPADPKKFPGSSALTQLLQCAKCQCQGSASSLSDLVCEMVLAKQPDFEPRR